MDTVSPETRSRMMAGIRSKNTRPEIVVRKWLHAHGYRFRLHRKDLPGCPDIVLPKYRLAIFVHGCFWHRHEGCGIASVPKTRTEWWTAKFRRTTERDAKAIAALEYDGWQVLVIWECEIRNGVYCGKLERMMPKGDMMTMTTGLFPISRIPDCEFIGLQGDAPGWKYLVFKDKDGVLLKFEKNLPFKEPFPIQTGRRYTLHVANMTGKMDMLEGISWGDNKEDVYTF